MMAIAIEESRGTDKGGYTEFGGEGRGGWVYMKMHYNCIDFILASRHKTDSTRRLMGDYRGS